MTKTEFCRRNQISTRKNQIFSNSKSSTYEKTLKKFAKLFGGFGKRSYLCKVKMRQEKIKSLTN